MEERKKLKAAGERLLQYMKQSGLAANAEKTNFVMFSKDSDTSIEVGNASVEKANEEKLVGVWLSGDLSWEKNLLEKEARLRQRIGLLRRLSWHFPREILLQCITPLLTSQLMYGLELMANPFRHRDKNQPNCPVITRLQRLLNEGVRASLGVKKIDKISESELMRRSGQLSVCDLAERAILGHSWSALSTKEREGCSELAKRIEWGQRERVTRQSKWRKVPPQTVEDTLVSKMGQGWNFLPEDIKCEEDQRVAKEKIKLLFQ